MLFRSDSYYQFIELILKNQNNPFFPRIHSAILTFEKEIEKYMLMIVMEKLVSLKTVNVAARHILSQLGISDTKEIGELEDDDFEWMKYWFEMGSYRRKLIASSKNPQFKKAMALLEPYFAEHGPDMHEGNIMVRSTGHGPQLVLIDPLFPSGLYY